MSAHPQTHLTPEQYLELDRASEVRNEYYDGVMYAMSGASHMHAIISGNLLSALRTLLRTGPCITTQSDLRVQVSEQRYVYPDVVVVCEEPQYGDSSIDTLLNPSLVMEVLSGSTEAHDRGFKSALYRKIPSLREYGLVSQDEPRVEIFRRQPAGEWLLSEAVGMDATCTFEGLAGEPMRVALAEIYERVTFPEPIPGLMLPKDS